MNNQELYYKTEQQPRELFIKSLLHFREIMCSKEFNFQQKEQAFQSLAQDYFRCDLKESDINMFKVISREWEIRSLYEVVV